MPPNSKAYLYDMARAARLVRKFTDGISLDEYQKSELRRSAVER